jgi:hypothetical protein
LLLMRCTIRLAWMFSKLSYYPTGGKYSMSASASPELGGNRRGNVTRQ